MNALDARLDAERTIPLSRYQEDGWESRSEYLRGLAENVEVELDDIIEIVDLLGPDEDFDGLVTFFEDHEDQLREMANG